MAKKDLREESRGSWVNSDGDMTVELINLGCQLRIADATEAMAKNYVKLQDAVDWYKKQYRKASEDRERERRSNQALRAVITKMKNKK
jgi:hypothetical protein